MTTPSVAPELRFRLPGTWFPIDVTSSPTTNADALAMAESIIGKSDDTAVARILFREQIARAAAAARDGEARGMFIASEITPGVSLPVTLTLYEPASLRMSPAIGTDSSAVLDVLRESFARMQTPGLDEAEVIQGDGFAALRLRRTQTRHWEPTPWAGSESGVPATDPSTDPATSWAWAPEIAQEAEQYDPRHLVVDYWTTVPGSKSVILVSFVTTFGDIPLTMVRFFDAIVAAAYYAAPVPAQSEPGIR